MSLPSIIDAIEFRRDQYGLTQRDWAKRLGLTASHYTEIKQGKRTMPLTARIKAFHEGVPAEILLQKETK